VVVVVLWIGFSLAPAQTVERIERKVRRFQTYYDRSRCRSRIRHVQSSYVEGLASMKRCTHSRLLCVVCMGGLAQSEWRPVRMWCPGIRIQEHQSVSDPLRRKEPPAPAEPTPIGARRMNTASIQTESRVQHPRWSQAKSESEWLPPSERRRA